MNKAFERLAVFVDKFKFLHRKSPYVICLYALAFCILVNSPIYFSYQIQSNQAFNIALNQTNKILNFCQATSFLRTAIGIALAFAQILIRDILTLVVEIVTSFLAVYYYRKLVVRFQSLNDQLELNTINVALDNKISKTMKEAEKSKLYLLMTIILSALSIVSHVVVCISIVISFDGVTMMSYYFQFLSTLALGFKHFFNFFIYYAYNIKFRANFRAINSSHRTSSLSWWIFENKNLGLTTLNLVNTNWKTKTFKK